MKGKSKKEMSKESFDELTESLNQVLKHRSGKIELRTTTLPKPPSPMSKRQILRLRNNLNFSQAVFAKALNVSIKTIQAWEQGQRVPSDAALKLLSIAARHPEVLLEY